MKQNRLIKETSPYLLQHSENPVDWYPYGREAFEKARRENKLLIISIGYSTCHWCHVMEHESFENEKVAEFMNNHFVSVKVDREEMPDVDNYYMDSVSLMTGRGGWPLNVITLPDGRPVYGGTYFPRNNWLEILSTISNSFQNNPGAFEEYAEKLGQGLKVLEIIEPGKDVSQKPQASAIPPMIAKLRNNFDYEHGGWDKAPKFPMPTVLNALLDLHLYSGDQELFDHLSFTLEKMHRGGIYDQIGGGFSRYSTDNEWKIPHFEKMLYDNAQLVSVYSRVYRVEKNPAFRSVIEETLGFLLKEFKSPEGGYYSALDADSEGEEGTFYVWEGRDFEELFGDDAPVLMEYFGIAGKGYWENGKNVLLKGDVKSVAEKFGLSEKEVGQKIREGKEILYTNRENRPKPSLDNKMILSWNALTGIAFLDAYLALGEKKYLEEAESLISFINSSTGDGEISRELSKAKGISGFLDDRVMLAKFLLFHYQVTFNEDSLNDALKIIDPLEEEFKDPNSPFYFLNREDHYGIGKNYLPQKKEISDNVIPSSNSVLAEVYLTAGALTLNTVYLSRWEKMIKYVGKLTDDNPYFYGNWVSQQVKITKGMKEVAITGPKAMQFVKQLTGPYNPFYVIAATTTAKDFPALVANRFSPGKTMIYVCEKGACGLPVSDLEKVNLS